MSVTEYIAMFAEYFAQFVAMIKAFFDKLGGTADSEGNTEVIE